jgi:hypothetical protein
MPITTVTLVNTFDEWRIRTNESITVLNNYLDDGARDGSYTYRNLTANVVYSNTVNSNTISSNTLFANSVSSINVNSGIIFTNTIILTANNMNVDQAIRSSYDQANTARTHANGGFDQANTARTHANGAFIQANVTAAIANAAYDQANTGRTHANGGFDQANTARTHANGAFNQANVTAAIANAAYDQANTARTHANGAFAQANTAFSAQNVTSTVANAAFDRANTAAATGDGGLIVAIGAFSQANIARTHANGGFGQANLAYDQANTGRTHANGGFDQANTARTHANGAFNQANVTAAIANAAFDTANAAGAGPGIIAVAAFGQANTGRTHANGAFGQANLAYDQANTARTHANGAFGQANVTAAIANAAFDRGNTAVLKTGNTMTGNLVMSLANIAFPSVAVNSGLYWTGTTFIHSPATSTLVLGTGSTERVRIDSSGRVGIGIVPSAPLQVLGSISSSDGTQDARFNNDGGIELTKTAGDAYIDFRTSTSEDYDCRIAQVSNGLRFYTGGDTTSSERMRIDSSGQVGIGTATPAATLDVVGTFSVAKANVLSQTLTDGATISWDTSLGQVATVTLGGNRTMAAPTNLKVGTYILHVIQDGVGGRTITWNSIFKWSSGVAPALSSTGGRRDVFSFVSDGTNLYGAMIPDVR